MKEIEKTEEREEIKKMRIIEKLKSNKIEKRGTEKERK
jgi:hypothetical protein